MSFHLTIDRYEGAGKAIAVLLTDDGEAINVPRRLLPRGAKAGDVLTVRIQRDRAATKEVAERTRAVEDELDRRDTPGDVSL
jgi:hypothetical protein